MLRGNNKKGWLDMDKALSITQLKTNIIEIMGKILNKDIPSNEVIRSLVGFMSDVQKNVSENDWPLLAKEFGEAIKILLVERGFEAFKSLCAAHVGFESNAFLTRQLDNG